MAKGTNQNREIEGKKLPVNFTINWGLSLSIFIPAIITVVSWLEASKLESDRDRDNKLRDIKITYLIDAYRKLANASQRTEKVEPYHRDIEAAVADIQLFGSPEQVKEITIAIDTASAQDKRQLGHYILEFDPILFSLRSSLRNEIQLSEIKDSIRWVRFLDSPTKNKDTVKILSK